MPVRTMPIVILKSMSIFYIGILNIVHMQRPIGIGMSGESGIRMERMSGGYGRKTNGSNWHTIAPHFEQHIENNCSTKKTNGFGAKSSNAIKCLRYSMNLGVK